MEMTIANVSTEPRFDRADAAADKRMTLEEIVSEVEKLDAETQMELLNRLRASFAELDLTPAQKADLARRIARRDANPGRGYSFEEVMAYARGTRG